jgi:putative ABC transport system ATP-binding protein
VKSAVVLEQVTKSYSLGPQSATALSGVSLAVEPGEFVSVMGPSGAGKSTLLYLVAGLDTPTSGHVWLAGHDLASLSDDARSDLRLRHVGIVFQGFNLLPSFTVEENVLWPLEFLGVPRRSGRARVRAALSEVGLPEAAFDRRPAELSGGELQRVAIARALVIRPTVLLADEPTGNLDSRTGQVILDLLRRLNVAQELTIIMVTHNAFAATYGHRTVELQDGRIVRDVRAPRDAAKVVHLRD